MIPDLDKEPDLDKSLHISVVWINGILHYDWMKQW